MGDSFRDKIFHEAELGFSCFTCSVTASLGITLVFFFFSISAKIDNHEGIVNDASSVKGRC